MGVMVSPITGGDGNVEFLVHAVRGERVAAGPLIEAAVAAAVDMAEQG